MPAAPTRRPLRRRARVTASLLLVAGIGLTGCGSGGDRGSATGDGTPLPIESNLPGPTVTNALPAPITGAAAGAALGAGAPSNPSPTLNAAGVEIDNPDAAGANTSEMRCPDIPGVNSPLVTDFYSTGLSCSRADDLAVAGLTTNPPDSAPPGFMVQGYRCTTEHLTTVQPRTRYVCRGPGNITLRWVSP